MADKKITRQLSIFVNGQEVKNSLGAIGREIAKVKAQLKEANDPEDIQKYKAELDELGKAYGEVKTEVHGTNQTLQEARGHWSNLLGGILGGDIDAVKAGMSGIKAGITGATKSAMAFIATPIGAAIAALAVIGGAAKLWFDYNTEIAESIKLTEQLTGFSGEELSGFRASVQATASTFDKEFNEVLRSANSLSKQMKITQQEALDLINQGFVRGADVGGDFLEKLEEYPIHFKNAGYSAQDFIDIATQEAKGGVYNDKLVDTLKEVDLALKEMTKTQRDALQNAFGQTFADEIAKGVKSGELTTKEAIGKIITESEKLGLNYQQQQQIVADLFKGAGEDAGGLAEIIIQLDAAFKEENKTLNENEAATARLVEANIAYETALADLFDASSSGFPSMLTNLKSIGSEITANILVGLKLMFTSIEDLKRQAGLEGTANAVKDVAKNMKEFGTTAADETKYMVDASIKNVTRLKKEVEDASGFFKDPFGIIGKKDALQQQLAKEEAYLEELKTIATGKSKTFDDFQKSLNPEKNKVLSTELSQEEKDAQAKIDAEKNKKSLAAQKEAADKLKAYQKTENELNDVIKKLQEERLLNTKTGFEKELLAVDQKYAALKEKFILSKEEEKLLSEEQLKAHNAKLAEIDEAARIEKEELKIQNDAAFKLRLEGIEAENKIIEEEARFEREALEAETEAERVEILLEKTRWIANEKIRIEEEAALRKLKLEGATAAEIEAIKHQYDLKRAKTEAVFNAEKAAADQKAKEDEQQVLSTRLAAYSTMFGNISKLLGEHTAAGKAAAIAQATMNTYQGITEVWAAKTVLPEPFGTAAKIVSTATVLASGLSAVKSISATKTPKAGFYQGGYTGNNALYNDGQDGVVGPAHVGEWYAPKWMNESPRYAPTIQWLEHERLKSMGKGYFNGGNTSPISNPVTAAASVADTPENSLLLIQITRLNNHLDAGILATALIGDDKLLDIQDRTKIINNARESAKIN